MNEPFIGITCDVDVPRQRQKAYDLVIDHRYAEIVKNAFFRKGDYDTGFVEEFFSV